MKREFYNISLSDRNSFKIEESAAKLIEFDSAEDLTEIFGCNPPEEWYILSGGNNVLFTKRYDGVILTPTSSSIEILESSEAQTLVRVDAGVEWDDFVEWAVEHQLWGVENLSMIPGKVGAAPVQNIGAYGVEVKDSLVELQLFRPSTLTLERLSCAECEFGYRDSIFKGSLRGDAIILSVTFRLSSVANPMLGYGDVVSEVQRRGESSLRNIREAICAIRASKLPDTAVTGNAGSFFKNPIVSAGFAQELQQRYPQMPIYRIADRSDSVKLAAGWLIDEAGLKGHCEPRVGVHPKQALVLINLGGATGADVMALADKIIGRVEELFGVKISPEVNLL